MAFSPSRIMLSERCMEAFHVHALSFTEAVKKIISLMHCCASMSGAHHNPETPLRVQLAVPLQYGKQVQTT